ncbi:T9SS type A sorting domain-containing protein [Taibaiella chishuiensis]|uniref:Putative secreted protein (Por secretion system target) n=1 Tax=Taibaiella chishuiensis TaxID=1434707 RepID=A0A2P8DD74_9BACT|nr:T9SS type A sorting domain-containing protein [Taibaiella chishuiensis]PSK95145.1 putative secreted protein (Por secretion system target) [Taibaiella chishuiensis]
MKRVKLLAIIALLSVSMQQVWGQAVTLGQWNFAGQIQFGVSPFAASTTASNITVGGLTRGPGVTTASAGNAAGDTWGGNGFDNSATAAAAATNGDYVTFTVTPSSGYTISFSEIGAFNTRRSNTGAREMQWQYSLNGTTYTDIGTSMVTTSTSSGGTNQGATTLSNEAALTNVPAGTTVTFRLLVYNATAAGGNWYMNGASGNPSLIIRGVVGTALPLHLLSFKGQQENNGNRLNWATAQESNVARFAVERSSNGQQFTEVASLEAKGNDLNGNNQYTYLDAKVNGTALYRLKMIDRDNRFSYSNIVALRKDAVSSAIRVYPNPTRNTLFVEGLQGKTSYSVTDATGRKVMAATANGTGNALSLDVAQLAPGLYFMQYADDNGSASLKFVKQ